MKDKLDQGLVFLFTDELDVRLRYQRFALLIGSQPVLCESIVEVLQDWVMFRSYNSICAVTYHCSLEMTIARRFWLDLSLPEIQSPPFSSTAVEFEMSLSKLAAAPM